MTRGTAAQTRMVSGAEFWRSQWELSQHLKYMALARIPEFESSHARGLANGGPLSRTKKAEPGAGESYEALDAAGRERSFGAGRLRPAWGSLADRDVKSAA